HVFGFCFPLGFCIVEGGRTEAILSLLSSIVSSLPDKLTLLVDGGLMNQRLVEWVKKNKPEWELIGLIRRDMIVSYRGRRGRVDEIVKEPKVVYVRRWGCKVMGVPFERKNGKVYYLACTNTKLSAEKIVKRYKKRSEIEVAISVLKQ
ncbi:MAG: transposase, partial [Armatimonadetes bacterium]|nr:transposase [Armatimonadota bacterium]